MDWRCCTAQRGKDMEPLSAHCSILLPGWPMNKQGNLSLMASVKNLECFEVWVNNHPVRLSALLLSVQTADNKKGKDEDIMMPKDYTWWIQIDCSNMTIMEYSMQYDIHTGSRKKLLLPNFEFPYRTRTREIIRVGQKEKCKINFTYLLICIHLELWKRPEVQE